MTSSAFTPIGSCAAFALAVLLPLPAQEAACAFDASQVQLGPLDPALEAMFDLDGDSCPDAFGALFGTSSSVLGIYPNDSTGRLERVWSTTARGWFGANFVLAGDFDGDGRRDDFAVVVSGIVQIFYCDGVGAPTVVGPVTPCPVPNLRDAEVADLDNDGRDDLIVSALDSSSSPYVYSVSMFLSGTAGASPTITTVEPSLFPARVRTARVPDGSHGILAIDALHSAQLLAVESTASNIQIPPTTLADGLGDPTAGDIDGDGNLDALVTVSAFGNPPIAPGVRRVMQGRAGHWQLGSCAMPLQTAAVHPEYFFRSLVSDLDGDGFLDLVVTSDLGNGSSTTTDLTSIYHSAPDGRLTTPGLSAFTVKAIADVDRNGPADLIVARRSIGYGVCLNRGSMQFDPPGTVLATPTASFHDRLSVADLDGDSDLDLVLPEAFSGNAPTTVVVALNVAGTPPPRAAVRSAGCPSGPASLLTHVSITAAMSGIAVACAAPPRLVDGPVQGPDSPLLDNAKNRTRGNSLPRSDGLGCNRAADAGGSRPAIAADLGRLRSARIHRARWRGVVPREGCRARARALAQ